jgi:hypothetical protein
MQVLIFIKGAELEAINLATEPSNTLRVFFGQCQDKRFKKRDLLNRTVEMYTHELTSKGFIFIGEGVISNTGVPINFDTDDSINWSVCDGITGLKFIEYLRKYVSIYTTNKGTGTLNVDENGDTRFLINFNESVVVGVNLASSFNVVDQYGCGTGKISLFQSKKALLLLLYLQANSIIKISCKDEDLVSKVKFPFWLKEFIASDITLRDALGLGDTFSRLKKLEYTF